MGHVGTFAPTADICEGLEKRTLVETKAIGAAISAESVHANEALCSELEKWTVGGGVYASSKFYNQNAEGTLTADAYITASGMGVSTIYLAAALRDNGGGRLIGSELEPAKVARARTHLDAAGLGDLVDIREGDALETLKDVGGEVDLRCSTVPGRSTCRCSS